MDEDQNLWGEEGDVHEYMTFEVLQMTDWGQVPSLLWVSVSPICHARELDQIEHSTKFSGPEVLLALNAA